MKTKKTKIKSVGKYVDTATKATMKVYYFNDDIGNFKLTSNNLKGVVLKGCRFQVKGNEVKKKKRFSKKIKIFLDFSSGFKDLEKPDVWEMPLLFGLLKLRKGKQRKFILIQSADSFYNRKFINIVGVIIDNLLYAELVSRLKNIA